MAWKRAIPDPVGQPDSTELAAVREELDALRRRLDEQGALIRRTSTAVTSLADSLGKVVASQKRRERWINLNSFVAYTLFTVLLGGGFFALYDARASDLLAARDVAVRERDSARAHSQELGATITERSKVEKRALEYYDLLRDDKRRAEAIARHGEIDELALTPTERALFADGVKEARTKIVDAGYLAGVASYRGGDFDKAQNELRTALAYEEEGPRAAQMRYYLGMSFYKKGDHEQAAHELELSIAGRVDQAGVIDARYYLALALESAGKFERARAEYDKFAGANPQHPWALTARRRSAMLIHRGIQNNTN